VSQRQGGEKDGYRVDEKIGCYFDFVPKPSDRAVVDAGVSVEVDDSVELRWRYQRDNILGEHV
jgi:hypothetical protein